MSIKTNSGLFDVEIFETYEFQSALAAGGYDEWNSVSLQQIQYMEEWNQQIQSMQPDYWYQLHQSERERERERRIQAVHTMQQMQQISPQQAEQLLQMHQAARGGGATVEGNSGFIEATMAFGSGTHRRRKYTNWRECSAGDN